MTVEVQMSLQDPGFFPLGHTPGSGIAGSYGSSVFRCVCFVLFLKEVALLKRRELL